MAVIRSLASRDLPVLAALLAAEGLPAELLTADVFWCVAEEEGRVVGCAALDRGMVRSLAVAPAARGQGVGRALMAALLGEARRAGMTELYLLTEHAAGFFRRVGFFVIDRMQVPEPLRRQPVFAAHCPACSVAMAREVPAVEDP